MAMTNRNNKWKGFYFVDMQVNHYHTNLIKPPSMTDAKEPECKYINIISLNFTFQVFPEKTLES